jgi:hypothetical protein
MNKWTIIIHGVGIIILVFCNFLHTRIIERLRKRVLKIESKIWADNLTEEFFIERMREKINHKRATESMNNEIN